MISQHKHRGAISNGESDRISVMVFAGMTTPSIASELGITQARVDYVRYALKIRSPRNGGTQRNGYQRGLAPASITADPFSLQWFAQNDASFRAGIEAASQPEETA